MELTAQFFCFQVIRQPILHAAQVDVLLAQVFEIIAENRSLNVVVRRPRDCSFQLGHRVFEVGNRLFVFMQSVTDDTLRIPAPC